MKPIYMTRGSNRRRADAGFTLVELLVSLTILALIMSFLPATLTLGSRVWEAQDGLSQQGGQSAFLNHIEQRLSEAMPVFERNANGQVQAQFVGGSQSLQFIAPAGDGLGKSGVYRFKLSQRKAENSQNHLLVLSRQLHSGNIGKPVSHKASKLVAPVSIRTLSIRYFGSQDPGQPARWLRQWPREDTLPALVEIGVRTSEPGAKLRRRIVELRLRNKN